MKRVVGIFLSIFIGVAVLLVGLVSFLGTSESGTRLLMAQAERWLPLRVEDVSGTLWREVAAAEVVLELESGRLEIRRIVLALRLVPASSSSTCTWARTRPSGKRSRLS